MTTRRYVVIYRTKDDDVNYHADKVTARADALLDHRINRVVIAPPYEAITETMFHAMRLVWEQGGWTEYVDELYEFMRRRLQDVDKHLTQGRSKRISVVTGMQRPVGVTRFALSQATHNIAFSAEGRDCRTLAEAGTVAWANAVARLRRHEFAWLYRPTREVFVGRVQDLIFAPGERRSFRYIR